MKLVVGCGYLGSRVARLWQERGDDVAVVTRSAGRARDFQSAGYRPITADVTDADSLSAVRQLTPIDTVLCAVGHDRSSGKSMRDVYVDGLGRLLDALAGGVNRLIYISTTGVYGESAGNWLDEDSPCRPARERGRICLEAEAVLQRHELSRRVVILRLAGIYGPGRIPRREELLAGKPLAADPDAYLNLIQVDDAARVVLAVERQIEPPRVYLVADGHPVVRREYYAEAARLLGAPQPIFAPNDAGGVSDRRGNTDKRVSNARLTGEVRFEFLYPSYRHGLGASIAAAH